MEPYRIFPDGYTRPDDDDARRLGVSALELAGLRLLRIGDHYRLPVTEFGELAAYVFWPVDAADRWVCPAVTALNFDAWALGPLDAGPLVVTRSPAAWLRRAESWCPLMCDPKAIGVAMLAAGRPLAFTSAADAAWARLCIASVTLPRMPRLLVERQMARAA